MSLLHFLGVERVLEHRDERVLGQLVVLGVGLAPRRLAEREPTQPVAGDLVQRLADDADVLRLLGLAAVEVGARRGTRASASRPRARRPCFPEQRGDGIERDCTAGSTVRCQASWSCSSASGGRLRRAGALGAAEVRRASAARATRRGRRSGSRGMAGAGALLELVDAEGERLAREVGRRAASPSRARARAVAADRRPGASPRRRPRGGRRAGARSAPAAGSPARAAARASRR